MWASLFHSGDLLWYAASPFPKQRLTLDLKIPEGTKEFRCLFDLCCYPEAKLDHFLGADLSGAWKFTEAATPK